MSWETVSGMPLSPHACIACGQNPRDAEGNFEEALFAAGVDVGWGEAVYLCSSCQNVIVQLVTGQTIEEVEANQGEINKLTEELRSERKEHTKLKKRVQQILKGARAKERVSNDN